MKHSPVVSPIRVEQIKKMDFVEALKELVDGKKVRRLEWQDESVYLTVEETKLMIFLTSDNMLHPLTVQTGDILGEDWVVIEELKQEKGTVH